MSVWIDESRYVQKLRMFLDDTKLKDWETGNYISHFTFTNGCVLEKGRDLEEEIATYSDQY